MRTSVRFVLLFCLNTMYTQTPMRQQPRFALEISEDGFPSRFVIVPEEPQGSEMRFFGSYLHLLPGRDAGWGHQVAETRRLALAAGTTAAGPVTASFGVASQGPGETALIAIPWSASSTAMTFVNNMSPAFAAP